MVHSVRCQMTNNENDRLLDWGSVLIIIIWPVKSRLSSPTEYTTRRNMPLLISFQTLRSFRENCYETV